jgi:alpha-glucosidase
MQWDGSANGGFGPSTGSAPWLPVTADCAERNVANQLADPTSMLNLYRTLLQYRKESKPLQIGSYRRSAAPAGCYAYERTTDRQQVLVALNFTGVELRVPLESAGTVVLSTNVDRTGEAAASEITLGPDEGIIIEIG